MTLSHQSGGLGPANKKYYFDFGRGRWKGRFRFRITDWKAWWRARLGLKNRLITALTHAMARFFGEFQIASQIEAYPEGAENGVATNEIFVRLGGLVVYRQSIEYRLGADGTSVTVVGWERHGPVPWLFTHQIQHWGRIAADGLRAEYNIPMLGDTWVGEYSISADLQRVRSEIRCPWGESGESLERV